MHFPTTVPDGSFFSHEGLQCHQCSKYAVHPAFGRPPELTEEVQESLAVLSQLVDLENYLFLAIHQMKMIMTRLEKEFQRELQVRITITGLTCDPA